MLSPSSTSSQPVEIMEPSKTSDVAPPQTSLGAWSLWIDKAMRQALPAKQLATKVTEFESQWKIKSFDLATILLRLRRTDGRSVDHPLLFQYTDIFLDKGYIKSSHLLLALLQTSSFGKNHASPRETDTVFGWPSLEERMFTSLARRHMQDLPSSCRDTLDLVRAITEWLAIVSENEITKQVDNPGLYTMDDFTMKTYRFLAELAIRVFMNPTLRKASRAKWWVQNRGSIVEEIRKFSTNVLALTHSDYADHLNALTNQSPFIEIDKAGRPVFTDQQVLDLIPEVVVMQSRAGLFIWLNAALAARPMTDSMVMLSYLQARFPGDAQSSVVSLLAASFDVLINAMLQKETRQSVKIIRSFICNKLPVLLSLVSGSIAPPMTIEACIQLPFMAGGMISMDPLPPITPGASDVNESLKATRLDFLQACALHGLVSEAMIASILNGPVALPRTTKLVRDSLVAQCTNNVGRLESLIDDMVGFQGNSGAIAQCIVTVIDNLCASKDTMSLKTVCNELIKTPSSLDILMQYTHHGELLLPLCTLLNGWLHDQDQAEFTPSYEEFASILLLTISAIHRYNLEPSEIGIASDTFVAKLIDEISTSKSPSDLTEDQNSHLKRWIENLFAVDEHGETIGIRDDVMRHCSPQAFYPLVPTLFEQSVLACRVNALPMRTFQGGLELLLEPLLLPSLILGLSWLSKHSWEDHNDAGTLLHVLDKLLKPSSSSQETLSMHRAIITIVANPLYSSLQALTQKQPQNKKAIELTGVLHRNFIKSGNLDLQRTLYGTKSQLDALTQVDGKVRGFVTEKIKSLINWSMSTSDPHIPPPPFSYRQFAISSQILQGDVLLDCVMQVLKQVPIDQMPLALDVCTAVACAPPAMPTGAHQVTRVTEAAARPRNAIIIRAADVQALLDRPQVEAEALIHLSRQVANQLAIAQLPAMAMPVEIAEQATDQIMQDLGLISTDIAGATNDLSLDQTASADLSALGITASADQQMPDLDVHADTTAMDLDSAGLFGDMDLSMDQTQQNAMPSAEEDIFAGLTGLEDMDDFGEGFSFD